MFESRATSVGTSAHEARAGVPMEPRRLLGVARRGARILVASTAISALGGVVTAKTWIVPVYEAAVVLQWDHDKESNEDESRELTTVVDGVKLPANLEKARARLGLAAPLPKIGRRVSVISSGDSNVVTLKATAADGAAAERLADAVTTAFLEHRVTIARQRLEDQARTLAANAEHAREDLLAARKEYHDLLAQNGIADLAAEVKAAVEQAARLGAESQLARAESEAEVARAESLGRVARAERRTTVLQETEVMPKARKLAEANAELAALRAQLSGDHPRVRALEAQVGALRTRGSSAPESVTAERTVGRNPQWEAAQQGLHAAVAQRDAAQKRLEALAASADQARAAVARLSQIEGDASKPRTRAKAAEDHLGELEVQLARVQDAARAPSSGFRVLMPATAPPAPAQSKRALVAIGAPLVGLALAALFMLLRELRGLRVLAAGELAYWGRAPVIAVSTWPREAGTLADLVADVEPCFRRARGPTLLFGLGEEEARHADLLVGRLDPAGARARAVSPGCSGAAIRRAARGTSRVLVLVEAGRHDVVELSALRTRLGRDEGVGLILLGLGAELAHLPDRVGDTEAFWSAGGAGTANERASVAE